MGFEHISAPLARVIDQCADAFQSTGIETVPSAPKKNCTNCKHSWVLGLKSGSEARACDNRNSNHWRHVRMPNATCKQWGGQDDAQT